MIHPAFTLKKTSTITVINAKLLELEHKKTGAKVLHLENDDPENSFSINLKTFPKSSDGAPHILEHTVLCGSRKYPVKDPFFSMTRRSLNTFMNAFTGADFTMYPASSQVEKDFYNLFSVYLDAVFHPTLKHEAFLQEGHRLEFQEGDNANSPLEIKGIVYNEMKGDQSSPEGRLADFIHEHLFPTLPYRFNFGGEPKDIPDLTWEGLRAFHKEYYHPSRALFYFYGNLPLNTHLEFLEENLLKDCDRVEDIRPLGKERRFEKRKILEGSYPVGSDEEVMGKTFISFSFLTCPILDQKSAFALELLDILLMGTDASPLKKALLKSGLCRQADMTLQEEYSEIPVTITLKGCEKENFEALKKIVYQTLEDVAATGFEKEKIESALHQLEFHKSEILGDGLPFGIVLMMRAAPLFLHGGNPEDGLVVFKQVEALNKQLEEEPGYLSRLIRTFFLDNSHVLETVFVPDKGLQKKEEAEERALIEKLSKDFSEKDTLKLVEQAKHLESYQEEDLDPSCLPKVALSDVPLEGRRYELLSSQVGAHSLYWHEAATNKIAYLSLVFPLPKIREEEAPLLRLLSLMIPELGCGGRTWEETLERELRDTGGISASASFYVQAEDYNRMEPVMVLQGKALERKIAPFAELMKDMATSVDFSNKERILEILKKHVTGLESSLKRNPLGWAIGYAAGTLDVPSRFAYLMGGLEYVDWVKGLVENFEARWEGLRKDLEAQYRRVFSSKRIDFVLTCDREMKDRFVKARFFGLEALCGNWDAAPWACDFVVPKKERCSRKIPAAVAFNARLKKGVPYIDARNPLLQVAARLMDNLVLHKRIREQGGAYIVGGSSGGLSGTFMLYSGRDPNIRATFEAFDEAMGKVVSGDFSDEALEEAKLEVIGGLDAPIAPGSRGGVAYAWMREGRDDGRRQAWREALLGGRREDVVAAVRDVLGGGVAPGIEVVFAGGELLEREKWG